MNARTGPWISLIFKCLSILACIFAFIFFMRMQEEQSLVERYRAEGVVSRAQVAAKELDSMRIAGRAGRSRTVELQVLEIRFFKDSTVAYADYPARVNEASLPVPPAPTGDPMIDGQYVEVMFVPMEVYNSVAVGDMLTVVDTPYSSDGPELISDIRDFDPSQVYPDIGIAVALAILLWLVAVIWRKQSRAG